MSARHRMLGGAAMLVSALGFGSTGVITRNLDATAWQIAGWRGLVGGLVVLGYVWWRRRTQRPRLQVKAAFTGRGLVLAGLGALSMILFISALQKTAVANVAVIMATIPFIAAGLAWLLLREQLRPLTVAAACVSFCGVLATVLGGVSQSTESGDESLPPSTDSGGSSSLIATDSLDGNLRAVGLAITLGLLIVLIRRFGRTDTDESARTNIPMGQPPGTLHRRGTATTKADATSTQTGQRRGIRRWCGTANTEADSANTPTGRPRKILHRRGGAANTEVDAVLAMAVAGVMLFVVALILGDPLGIESDQMPLVALFGVIFGVSALLWTEGIKLIPAAEAGLLASSETPFSIMLAWIIVHEAPPLATVFGGVLVLGAVLGHAIADLVKGRVSRPWQRPRARPRL